MVTLEDVLDAKSQLVSVIKPTDLIFSEYFSKFFGKNLYLKPENLQIAGSFKVRGAYYKLWQLLKESPEREVICVSAGNHAQGVAWAGQKLGFKVKVVMPKLSPIIKLEAVKKLEAEVLLFGENFEEAYLKAKEISLNENIPFVHPYNDPLIIAGQGTIGLEILEGLPDVGSCIVPVGGGGLIAGIALAIKETTRKQKRKTPKMVGVRSLSKIAEGILIKGIGEIPKPLINKYVDQMVAVEEEEIAAAILMLMEKSKLVVEGAGAVGLAALLSGKIRNLPDPIVVVLSGGNIDMNLVGKIIEKGLHNLGRMVSIVVEVEDRPGTLSKISGLIAAEGANILQIYHERSLPNLSLTRSRLRIILETWSKNQASEIIRKLKSEGYRVEEI